VDLDVKKRLSPYMRLVDAEISRYLDRDVEELYKPLRNLFSRGGKRIRPALCMISCEAVGGNRRDALKAAAAIEMIHNFTLIHDDIADRSKLRRGKPCLHHKYGLGIAINAGDGLFSVAYEALSDAVIQSGKPEIIADITKATTRVCEGQAMDISWVQERQWDLTEDAYLSMIRRKTGALMAVSCKVGGILGGGTKRQIDALANFGMDLGVGFQIHDDVLNLTGDVKKYGKEIGGDINEGKRTLAIIYTLALCTPEEKRRLTHILDKEENSYEEIKETIEILNKYGSVERGANTARELIEGGKKRLSVLPDSPAKKLLLDLASYIVKRER